MTLDRRPCAFPPHPASREDQEIPAGLAADSTARRLARWLAHAPAERLPMPAIPSLWTAAEILHLAQVPGLYPGAATLAAAGLAYGIGERRAAGEHPRLAGAEVAAVTGAAGAWLTAATIAGPLAGPDHLLSLLYLGAVGGGYAWLRRHHAVRAARSRRDQAAAWRERKAAWHRLAPLLGLGGSHLLAYDETLLGDSILIDTRGTGKRASQVSARDVAERLGEIEMIPAGRIDVTLDAIPGRLRITVRRRDPWASPLAHPVMDPASPFTPHVPVPASCRKPLVIGGDPETAAPLPLTVWDEDEGGKVILIVAKKGSGKTVLLSCIRERVTACADAILIQVNLSMVRHDRRWAPLAAANALGRTEVGRARRILQFVASALFERSDAGGDDRIVVPSPARPLLVVMIDEIDQVAADPVCQGLLKTIASKCRNEGGALIIAGQRATAQWVGGADLRANLDTVVVGRVARAGEARKATGEDIDLPDMGAYGEGRPGVFLVHELGGGGGYQRGRVFNLDQPAAISQIVADRLTTRQPYVLEPALAGLSGEWEAITRPGGDSPPGDGPGQDGPQPAPAGPPAGTGPAARGAGQVIPGTAAIRAKAGTAAGLAAHTPDLAEVPAETAARVLAERQRQFLDSEFGQTDIPVREASALAGLLASPYGTSVREAAAAIGASRGTTHRYLTRLRRDGRAEIRGLGRAARFYLATPGGPQRPQLRLVDDPDPGQEAASGDSS